MRRFRFLRSPSPVWAVQSKGLPGEARLLADRAVKLSKTRKLIWRVNLTLFGVLKAATLIITRRMIKKDFILTGIVLHDVGETVHLSDLPEKANCTERQGEPCSFERESNLVWLQYACPILNGERRRRSRSW